MKTIRRLLLGLVVIGILACGGGQELTPTVTEAEPPIEQPTSTAIPAISRESPTADSTSGMGTPHDFAYLECMTETSEQMSDFMSETSDVFSSYSDRVEGFCSVWAAYDFSGRLSDRRDRLFRECPMPEEGCLLRSRGLAEQAFNALTNAYGKVDLWCVDEDIFDATLLNEATDEFLEANAYLIRATEELQTCPWAE